MSLPSAPGGGGRRVFAATATVVLTVHAGPPPPGAGAAPLVLAQGRTAAMLVELALGALHYEDLEFGTVHLDLTPKKVTLRVERFGQPVHLAEPPESP